MKKLFTKMLAIVSLMLVGTLGSWAIDALQYKNITATTLIYTSPANLTATGFCQDGQGNQTYSPVTSDRGSGLNPTDETKNDYAIGTVGTYIKSANTAKNVLMYVKNVTKIEAYVKNNKANEDRALTITATPTEGTAASVTSTTAQGSWKTVLDNLDSNKSYTISFTAPGDITLYAVRLTAGEGSTVPALNGAWSKASDEVILDAEAPTLPKFGVTATSGSPVKGTDYTVAYSLKAGSTEGILTVDAANGVTAINTAVEGTATVVATVTNLNTTGYTLSTTTYEYTITVLGQPKSTVCTLNDLKVNGVTIEGFDPETKEYNYIVADDALSVPTVTYTVTDETSTVELTNSTSIYGQTKVKVIAEDDTKSKTYTITWKYPVVSLPAGKSFAFVKGQSVTGGEEITTGVDGVTFTCGATEAENKWKTTVENNYLPGFTSSEDGNGNNPTVTGGIPTAGTFYKFEMSKAGTMTVGVVLNSAKNLFVNNSKGETVFSLSSSDVKVKVYKTITFDVENGETYYLYASGTKLGLYGFTFEPAVAGAEVNISSVGYATFYDSEHAVEIPADVTAYIFGFDEDYDLGLVSYADALELNDLGSYEGIIPAGEPVVLQGSGLVTLNYATTTAEPVGCGINLLCGSDVETMATMPAEYEGEYTNDDFLFYALSLDTNGENVGFYWMTEAGAPFTTAAHKAYLVLPKAYAGVGMQAKSSFPFNPDNTVTGIRDINTVAKNSAAFNLAGQRVAKNAKGIVIINGTKRINK